MERLVFPFSQEVKPYSLSLTYATQWMTELKKCIKGKGKNVILWWKLLAATILIMRPRCKLINQILCVTQREGVRRAPPPNYFLEDLIILLKLLNKTKNEWWGQIQPMWSFQKCGCQKGTSQDRKFHRYKKNCSGYKMKICILTCNLAQTDIHGTQKGYWNLNVIHQ